LAEALGAGTLWEGPEGRLLRSWAGDVKKAAKGWAEGLGAQRLWERSLGML